MTTQERMEKVLHEAKTVHADMLKGRVSALYVDDWLRASLTTLVKQAFEEGRDISMKADEVLREEGRVEERERIVEYVQKAYCTQEHKDKHYCGFNDGEQVCDCYNEALDDLIAHLSEKQTEI